MESEQRLRETIEAQLASAQSDIEAEMVALIVKEEALPSRN